MATKHRRTIGNSRRYLGEINDLLLEKLEEACEEIVFLYSRAEVEFTLEDCLEPFDGVLETFGRRV